MLTGMVKMMRAIGTAGLASCVSGLSLAGILSTGACSTTQSIGSQLDDTSVTTQVRALLIQDRGINALNVNVTTDEGEVFLIGRVADRSARLKAEDYARSVAGVWSVINHLKVGVPADKKSYSADLKLRQNVESRILRDQNVLGFNIQVLVHESEIYLLGRVKNDNERQQAVNVARETAGVRGVHNYLKAGRLKKEESS